MALITGGIPVHSETNSVYLGSKRHEAITVDPRGPLCMAMSLNVLFDRWRSSFYVMAIMEWVHITWNGCETVNRSWLVVHKIEWA